MWRWVTRGLVLSLLVTLTAPALLAQSGTGFIGSLDHPDSNVPHSGVVLVNGWAFDPTGTINRIELFVDDQFQYRAIMGLPRIDVVEAYPNYSGLHNTNPGFQVGFLANRFTNGPHTVYVKVFFQDPSREPVEVGRRTINIDNSINQPPFGSVDQPDLAGVYNASGSFPVVGWATDADGVSRVDVQIDGGNLQSAMYGDSRPDVGAVFADFPAGLFSGFIANIDTTRVQDGVHTLTVTATDRLGSTRLIGRRTVQILNSEQNLKPFGRLDEPLRDAVLYGTECGTPTLPVSPPIRSAVHITPVRGWALDLGTRVNTGRVAYAELLVDGARWLSTDDCSIPFGAFANCYGLPRFDVQRYYPNYPDAPRAGFLFTLDVGFMIANNLFREGNHTLKVRVGDLQQTFADIPGPQGVPVFFKCAESAQDLPGVGYIDVPTAFDYVTGDVVFQGWALDFAGVAAVEIIVDGNFVGQAQYGFPRPDVREQWPQFLTSGNSGWRFTMDTTRLSNARHRVTARVVDGAGARSEIGSVDFYVFNPDPAP